MRPRARRRLAAIAAAIALAGLDAPPALAYLKLGVDVGGRRVAMKWSASPVHYYITERGVSGVGPMDLQSAVEAATSTWQAIPTSSIAYQFGGFTDALPLQEDGMSTIGFLSRPDLDRVLATTNFVVDDVTGEIVEADVFLNASFPWSTAANGEPGKYDVRSIALHELGHFGGLGHSALGETDLQADGTRRVVATAAVMFPIAFPAGSTSGRTLQPDDVAGISDLYPDNGFNQQTGSISGTVTKNGAGVFGAQVVAFNPATGALVANFTLSTSGEFSIAGLSPGVYVVRVEPLDDADVDGFFDVTATPVDTAFAVTFADRLVVVPRGGDSGAVQIAVAPR